ncbi:MAG: hypothetical protein EXQ52_09530, partial [Bryobacterales bacterium]|nr:hypothetical protein [Bryobacterales bacterium]
MGGLTRMPYGTQSALLPSSRPATSTCRWSTGCARARTKRCHSRFDAGRFDTKHGMKRAALVLAILALPAAGQKLDPITWSATLTPSKAAPGSKILARVSAKIEPGWHLYSLSVPRPIRGTAVFVEHETVASSTVYFSPPKRAFDPNFGFDTETYENSVDFLMVIELKADAAAGAVELPIKAR